MTMLKRLLLLLLPVALLSLAGCRDYESKAPISTAMSLSPTPPDPLTRPERLYLACLL